LASVGVNPVVFRILEIMLDVYDFTDAEEEEFRLRRMVFGSVFNLTGTTGGIRERIDCLNTVISCLAFSSTGNSGLAVFSLG
jgi:hypothetical protein